MNPISRVEHFLARIAGDGGKILTPITRIEWFLQRIIDKGGGGGGITVDTALSFESRNPVENRVITLAMDRASSLYEQIPSKVSVTEQSATITPENNTIYACGELTSLTISNPPATGAYSIVFTSGATATTTTIPSTILGLEDFAAEANTLYEINVLDNRAVIGSWAVST